MSELRTSLAAAGRRFEEARGRAVEREKELLGLVLQADRSERFSRVEIAKLARINRATLYNWLNREG